MSKEALRGFLDRLVSDERLRLETGAAVAAIASRNGFDCGAAECAGMFSAAGAELSEAALEEMAGGLGVQVIGLSIGHSAS
ncbi:MAG: Nif11 family protein, partial [Gemmatimonadetes bacterium]|nr:Nif11 family protein [Gemmatimonadota bacterium]